MSVTDAYSRVHEALANTAARHHLHPYDVRVLVAILERGGMARTDELEDDLRCEGTAIRRSSLTLRARSLIRADAGPGTERPRRGTRARLVLTQRGAEIAGATLATADTTP